MRLKNILAIAVSPFILLQFSCGVKGPPLPPLEVVPQKKAETAPGLQSEGTPVPIPSPTSKPVKPGKSKSKAS